ncbi:serine hydrolase domain-containing protein [Rhizobium sp. RCC_161_2]|uniref:serine hydrolase domain-containing protein n=1 Tax=Rhizobium sp. RCC_161_2 TaxID=3239219 RepID=UPI003523A466
MNGDGNYPGAEWAVAAEPETLGWSSSGLAEAYDFATSIGSSAIMIVQNGIVVSAWGGIADVTGLASIRKSLLSALIGTHEAQGTVDLSMTLAELGIDDCEPSLTSEEKQATIADLLTSRSGIYHAAADQNPASSPARGSHAAGTHWFYNNWDFNVLGVILERLTGVPIAEDFAARIAAPLEMQDFHPGHFYFKSIPHSEHPAYKIRMSARDLARVGVLFLNEGRWRDVQIVPAEWVERSTKTYVDLGHGAGYSYSWWTGQYRLKAATPSAAADPETAPFYWASGMGNQYLMVLPAIGTVIVHRVADTNNGPSGPQIEQLQKKILGSRTAASPMTSPITK